MTRDANPERFLYHRRANRPSAAAIPEVLVSGLVWLGIMLLVAWAVLWLGFNIVGGAIHLLVVIGIVLLAVGLLRRGARAVDRRL